MVRFGLRLSLRSGREALIRLVLTAVAVAAGVTVLLGVLAEFHAFEVTNARPAWEQTHGVAAAGYQGPTTDAALWSYDDDYYQGQTIERLDIAALGPGAPVPPGVAGVPAPCTYDVSPALAALLKTVPADELGARFPGTEGAVIGDAALTGPTELVVYVGYQPSQLEALGQAEVVTSLGDGPQTSVWTNYFRYAFGVGAVAFVLPIVILIGTATRLAAARREQRFAALRLVGATNRQIGVVAAVDAFLGAAIGTLAGIGGFLAVRPVPAGYGVIGTRYFPALVTPTAAGYLAVLAGVPMLASLAAVLSLRRVRISPLGVSRQVTPPAPSAWRTMPLLVGIGLFALGIAVTSRESIGLPAYPGLLIVLIGLVMAGPWLTARAADLLGRLRGSAAALLAARRLRDNPKAAFRSVSGLVLAVFLGTLLACLMPAINATTATPTSSALGGVLVDLLPRACITGCPGFTFENLRSLTSAQIQEVDTDDARSSAQILSDLRTEYPGAAVLPIYRQTYNTNPATFRADSVVPVRDGNPIVPDTLVPCAALARFPALGACPAGAAAVMADTSNLQSDNPYFSTQPIVDGASTATPDDVTGMALSMLLVQPTSPAQLEQIRTFLSTHTDALDATDPPKTFGEQVQLRLNVSDITQRLFLIAVLITIVVAGCSLAVAVGGGLVERKRPFGLLRLTGAGTGTLYRVVLLESVLPLITATIVAAGTAYGLAVLTVEKMAPVGSPLPDPGLSYYATTAGGLLAALAIIVAVLPVLGRITGPENARFE